MDKEITKEPGYHRESNENLFEEIEGVTLKKGLKAIIIGIRKYNSGRGKNDLPGAERDALSIANFLNLKWGLDKKDIHTFLGNVPYQETIDEIEKICSELTAQDNLLFYFAGHGEVVDEHSYLMMTDVKVSTVPGEPKLTNAIPLERLNELMKESKARVKVRIFDACHCGERFSRDLESALESDLDVFDEAKIEELLQNEEWEECPVSRDLEWYEAVNEDELFGPASERMMKDMMAWSTDWITFCSCNIHEYSYDLPSLGHGIFTYFLLKGLGGAAKRGDGRVYIEDLKVYICKMVPKVMAQMGRSQHPQYQCEIQGNVFVD